MVRYVSVKGVKHAVCRKKDNNLQRMFETAGIIMAHSVLQGRPAFPCLCPAAYSHMLHLDKERALEKLLSKEDIPRIAATSGLLSLIEDCFCVHMVVVCVCACVCVVWYMYMHVCW